METVLKRKWFLFFVQKPTWQNLNFLSQFVENFFGKVDKKD